MHIVHAYMHKHAQARIYYRHGAFSRGVTVKFQSWYMPFDFIRTQKLPLVSVFKPVYVYTYASVFVKLRVYVCVHVWFCHACSCVRACVCVYVRIRCARVRWCISTCAFLFAYVCGLYVHLCEHLLLYVRVCVQVRGKFYHVPAKAHSYTQTHTSRLTWRVSYPTRFCPQ